MVFGRNLETEVVVHADHGILNDHTKADEIIGIDTRGGECIRGKFIVSVVAFDSDVLDPAAEQSGGSLYT